MVHEQKGGQLYTYCARDLLTAPTMNVYQALGAARFLPRFAGAAPYDLSSTNIKFSRFGQIWSLLTLSLVVVYMYIYPIAIPNSLNAMFLILNKTTEWLQYFTATYSVIKDCFCQQAMIDIVQSIDQYDEKTGYNNEATGRQENKRVRRWSFVYTSSLIILVICRYCSTWGRRNSDPVAEIFTTHMYNAMLMVAMFTFVVSTYLLGLRVRHLNSIVEQDRIKVQPLGSGTVGNAEYVRELYSSLVASGDRLNDYYSARLFLWTTLIICALITQFYNMITTKMTATDVFGSMIRFLPFIFGFLIVSLVCEFTAAEINRTPAVLLEKSIRCTALIDRGRKEIFTLSLYMGLRPFEFSALGFFPVDLTLLYATVGTIVTYLALCLQTDMSGQSRDDDDIKT